MMRCVSDRCNEGRIDCPTPELCQTKGTTWHVAYRARRTLNLYRLMRRKIIWSIDTKGNLTMKHGTRGRIAALIALVKYWRAPVPF